MNKKLLAGVVLGTGAIVWVWLAGGTAAAGAETPPRDLFTVQRGDLRITIVENGTMVAKDSQKVTTKHRNESKILFLVEEGKEVAEGDEVCKLDAAPLTQQIEQIQLEILQTEANLKTARTELEIQTVESAANVRKAEIALDKAEKEIEKYKESDAPQERTKLKVALGNAETEFNKAQKKFADSERLLREKFIKQAEVDDDKIAFERAQVQRDGADVAIRMFEKYTFPMAITDHETKLADARREVDTSKKRGESQLGQKTVGLQQVEKRLKVQQDQLKERQKDLDNMTMKAPCPGIVVHGNPHEPWYRSNIKVGSSVYGGMTILTIPDLRVMQVKLQVHEADISKLKLGQRGSVTCDSYPGLLLEGEISKIATVANGNNEWGGGSTEVKKFDVEVTLKAPGVQLRPGVSAKAEIHIEVREQVLSVPLQSVFVEDGDYYCHVQGKDGPPQRKKIKAGKSNDNYMEVEEGLQEGDLVLLYNPLLPDGPGKDAKPDATRPGDGKPGETKAAPAAGNAGAKPEPATKAEPAAKPGPAAPAPARSGA
ncbi:MAG: efflux RND transporter periplasmic adaptor subunit [Planctomycetota bacterium]